MTEAHTSRANMAATHASTASIAITVAIGIFIIIVDGIDLLALSYAAPNLPQEWGLTPDRLGILLGLSPAGMAIGSFFFAPLADRFGRRPTIIAGLATIMVSMLISTLAVDELSMGAGRILTGLGVGTVTPVLNAIVVEGASARYRSLVLAIISAGLPIGTMIGGIISIPLTEWAGWQGIFVCGAVLSTISLLLCLFLLRESESFERERKALTTASQQQPSAGRMPFLSRLRNLNDDKGFLQRTLLLCLVSFCTQLTLYFILHWIPTILSDAGLAASDAITVSIVMSFGGIFGAIGFGIISRPGTVHYLTAMLMLVSFGLIIALALLSDLSALRLCSLAMGIAMFGLGVGLYSVIVGAFPARTRVSGLGMSIGIGRIGAVLGPVIAGFLISLGWSRFEYFLLLAMPLPIAAILLLVLRRQLVAKNRLEM